LGQDASIILSDVTSSKSATLRRETRGEPALDLALGTPAAYAASFPHRVMSPRRMRLPNHRFPLETTLHDRLNKRRAIRER
jgi:hypothetical protein